MCAKSSTKILSKKIFFCGIVGFLVLMGATVSSANDYPNKPINVYVGFAPGSSTGNAAHIFAEYGKKYLPRPQSILVNFKPGASSAIAADFVLKQPPDGYSLLLLTADLSGKLAQDTSLPFKLGDFLSLGSIGDSPHFLAVNNKSPFKTIEEFIDYAKKNPDKLSFGSSGLGANNYISTYLFMSMTGIKMNHVPFPGAGQTMTALLGGHIDCFVSTPGTAGAQIKPGGGLRVLTFFFNKRWPELPDVPTFREKGYDLERSSFHTIAAPRGTPKPILDILTKTLKQTAEDPQVKTALLKMGFIPSTAGPKETEKQAVDAFNVVKEFYKTQGQK